MYNVNYCQNVLLKSAEVWCIHVGVLKCDMFCHRPKEKGFELDDFVNVFHFKYIAVLEIKLYAVIGATFVVLVLVGVLVCVLYKCVQR
jgi:hypothetical protein